MTLLTASALGGAVFAHAQEVEVDENKVIVLADGAVAIRGDNESDIALALADAKALVTAASDNSAAIAAVSARIETAAQNLL